MKILVINGPNLNMLGTRDKTHYGRLTLEEINEMLLNKAKELEAELVFFQSNHEGEIIDFIQDQSTGAHGILINAGALTHYGYSLRDSLIDARLPIVEVHLSDVNTREEFRKISVMSDIAVDSISGLKEKSYLVGLEALASHIRSLLTPRKNSIKIF